MIEDHSPKITWDWGTAYDLFASLHVLHHPAQFGLRGSWAAGVRSRLPAQQRNILEQAQVLFINNPLAWVSVLPKPKDADTAIWSLGRIPPAERLSTLAYYLHTTPELLEVLKGVSVRQVWDENDLERVRFYHHLGKGRVSRDELVTTLTWWSHPEEFGERYLEALQAYVAVFFAEEEQRIKPYLQQALNRAQELSSQHGFSELFAELSQGVKIATLEEAEVVTFVPSYWITPLVMYDWMIKNHWVVLFGARPADVALVPGELVPDSLLRSLKALSDPTRLIILRYLAQEPQTPSQLARKLRLRSPTVIHHLNSLRLAGLVYVHLEEEEERRYAIRASAVVDTFLTLGKFLSLKEEG
jgi:DNA-binding transcriptional ArsR family regulator